MERKEFLKGMGLLGLGGLAVPFIESCSKEDDAITTAGGTGEEIEEGNGQNPCSISPTETEGPFPTHTPSSLVTNDIRSDRTGVLLTANIQLRNVNASNAALANVIVDIWHCDSQGNYSEYGGTGMQQVNYTNLHFLRGRQVSDASGKVSFTTIFPGWYNGRSTHIHVHIYSAAGNSLLVTQIAFPEGANSAVATVNASTENGYTKGMSGYTYNASDNVFSDSVSCQMSSITGSIMSGYVLESEIKVSA